MISMSNSTLIDLAEKQKKAEATAEWEKRRTEERARKLKNRQDEAAFEELVHKEWPQLFKLTKCRLWSGSLQFSQDFSKQISENHDNEVFTLTSKSRTYSDNEGPDIVTQWWELSCRYGFCREIYSSRGSLWGQLIKAIGEYPKCACSYIERYHI